MEGSNPKPSAAFSPTAGNRVDGAHCNSPSSPIDRSPRRQGAVLHHHLTDSPARSQPLASSKNALATPTLFPGDTDDDVSPKKATKKQAKAPGGTKRRSNATEMAAKQREQGQSAS